MVRAQRKMASGWGDERRKDAESGSQGGVSRVLVCLEEVQSLDAW